uniref:Glycosyltransferase n=1 Tax=Ziziphus jujuba TaxID=326968 RepID=A0A6P6FP93_ZIZJJ
MESEKTDDQLHIFFFPLMAQGHLIPIIDMAMLFASRGLKATIITTPFHAPLVSKTLQSTQLSGNSHINVNVLTIKFPCVENGLPEGCESVNMALSHGLQQQFARATTKLGPQLSQLLQQHRPDCLVADMLFPWATDVAARHGIPRLIFHGTCYFSLCASLCVHRYEPQKIVSSDSDRFQIPNLPGDMKFTINQLPDVMEDVNTEFEKLYKTSKEVEGRSYGVLVNSFYELEPVYADHYKKVLGIKAWNIGPLFLCNKLSEQKTNRGVEQECSTDQRECLNWLSSRKPNSVVYVCFGSLPYFSDAQLMEIALGLEASGHSFIWVVNEGNHVQGVKEEWLPEGFEKRMEGKGLIIRGWVPQVLILQHEAVGGFVTHCGWNSIMEGVCAGLPMVTWPAFAEQFFNEKLVTQILGIGVGVGAEKWARLTLVGVKREAIEKAVSRIMEGEEAEEMRNRAKALGEMARMAIREGGSSYLDLNAFIEGLKLHKISCDAS